MMKKRYAAVLAAAVVSSALFSASVSKADEIDFKNGDKLTGTIKSIDDGKIVMDAMGAGTVKADPAQVKTFSTDNPITLRLSNGDTLSHKVESDGDGMIKVTGGPLGNQTLRISDIEAINPPPVQWSGHILFGGLLVRGNTYTDSINANVDLALQMAHDKISFSGSYLYGKTKDRTTGVSTTSNDNWQALGRYDHDFTPKFYGFAEALVAKDRISFLDLRFAPAAGVGYKWFKTPKFDFATEGGLAWVYENYTNNTPTREDLSLKLAYHLNWKFNDNVSLFHNVTYVPSIENGAHYLIGADAGLRSALSAHWFTEFKVGWQYDSTPATGALKNNMQYQLSLGYTL